MYENMIVIDRQARESLQGPRLGYLVADREFIREARALPRDARAGAKHGVPPVKTMPRCSRHLYVCIIPLCIYISPGRLPLPVKTMARRGRSVNIRVPVGGGLGAPTPHSGHHQSVIGGREGLSLSLTGSTVSDVTAGRVSSPASLAA